MWMPLWWLGRWETLRIVPGYEKRQWKGMKSDGSDSFNLYIQMSLIYIRMSFRFIFRLVSDWLLWQTIRQTSCPSKFLEIETPQVRSLARAFSTQNLARLCMKGVCSIICRSHEECWFLSVGAVIYTSGTWNNHLQVVLIGVFTIFR